jgi:hypothetical protein
MHLPKIIWKNKNDLFTQNCCHELQFILFFRGKRNQGLILQIMNLQLQR